LLPRARWLDSRFLTEAPGSPYLLAGGAEGTQMMREPQEIPDEEYEQVLERVAAVDVAKASGMACTRVPHPERAGRRRTLVWEVPATTNAVLELADDLARERIQKITLEATSDYVRREGA